MPVIEKKPSNTWKWVLGGCGGALLIVIILTGTLVAIGIHSLSKTVSSMTSSSPASVPVKYTYYHASDSGKCNIQLPDNTGSITYQHVVDNKNYEYGNRAITVHLKNAKNRDLPLIYYSPSNVRIGLYWYSKKGAKGPWLLMKDSTGDQLIDMHNVISRYTMREGNRIYASGRWNPESGGGFGVTKTYHPSGTVVKVDYNGKPADDITNLINSRRKYLGSIVKVGNKLIFTPAP